MNEYSSNTKKVAAKLAGMTDACANVHDDERYDYPWHLCPLGWWGAATLKSGQRYFLEREVAESGEVRVIDNNGATEGWQNSVTRIPLREAELNWWADNYSSWAEVVDMTLLSIREARGIGKRIWQVRRQQRIAAGSTDVNDTDVVDMQDSQQTRIADAIMTEVGCDEVGYSQCVSAAAKVMELTQDSQQEWVSEPEQLQEENDSWYGYGSFPPEKMVCEALVYKMGKVSKWEPGKVIHYAYGQNGGAGVLFESSKSNRCYFIGAVTDFRPIQPDERDKAIFEMYRDATGEVFEGNEMDDGVVFEACAALYDAGYRLTQGGGDE